MRTFVIVFVIFLSFKVQGEPTVNTHTEYYDIFPTSIYDLGKELLNRTPINDNGKTFTGHTLWSISWKVNTKIKRRLCRVSNVSTSLKVIYTMPRISNGFQVKQSVRSTFEQYYEALFKHEKGHMESGLLAAREIEKEISSLHRFKGCKQLEKTAYSLVNKIIKKYRERDENYDRATKHGITEGVYIESVD